MSQNKTTYFFESVETPDIAATIERRGRKYIEFLNDIYVSNTICMCSFDLMEKRNVIRTEDFLDLFIRWHLDLVLIITIS